LFRKNFNLHRIIPLRDNANHHTLSVKKAESSHTIMLSHSHRSEGQNPPAQFAAHQSSVTTEEMAWQWPGVGDGDGTGVGLGVGVGDGGTGPDESFGVTGEYWKRHAVPWEPPLCDKRMLPDSPQLVPHEFRILK